MMEKTGEHTVGRPCTFCCRPSTRTLRQLPVCDVCQPTFAEPTPKSASLFKSAAETLHRDHK